MQAIPVYALCFDASSTVDVNICFTFLFKYRRRECSFHLSLFTPSNMYRRHALTFLICPPPNPHAGFFQLQGDIRPGLHPPDKGFTLKDLCGNDKLDYGQPLVSSPPTSLSVGDVIHPRVIKYLKPYLFHDCTSHTLLSAVGRRQSRPGCARSTGRRKYSQCCNPFYFVLLTSTPYKHP